LPGPLFYPGVLFMEHFSIVQALCRSAMANPSPAIRRQVERLRDALKPSDAQQASALTSILNAAERSQEIAPSRIVQSRVQIAGEMLSRGTHLPVDRETAAPLAELIFPSDISPEPPLFDAARTEAIASMLEEWSNIAALSTVGVQPSQTCLIYGAPGTGKTRLALWMARQLDLPVVVAKLDGLVSSFLGTTARNIGNLFAFANRYRCLLLLDEFDALAKLRDDPQEVGEIKRVVNALLQNLDSRRELGFTLGITNHAQLLDPAVWRRFEVQFEVPKPDFDVRVAITRHFMVPLDAPDNHLRLIAWFTEGLTGAEIETLVRSYKKASVVQVEASLLDTLRRFASLNSARVDPKRRDLLFDNDGALFQVMKNDPVLAFSLNDIGEVAGKDKSTISRQIGKRTSARKNQEAQIGLDG
jgi:ATPase family associated with various cellular activities (AAA)